MRAVEPVERRNVRAELVIDPLVIALAEQVQVELGQLRRKEIRVVLERLLAGAIADLQPIRLERPSIRYPPLEQPQLVQLRQLGDALRLVFPADGDRDGVGLEHAHDADRRRVGLRILVVTEHRARLGVTRLHERVDIVSGESGQSGHRASLAPYKTGLMCQIRSAYSRTLRSLEKMPMFSAFVAAMRTHAAGCR
jgi:hypothetical protein